MRPFGGPILTYVKVSWWLSSEGRASRPIWIFPLLDFYILRLNLKAHDYKPLSIIFQGHGSQKMKVSLYSEFDMYNSNAERIW
jgi:hypothetical protein